MVVIMGAEANASLKLEEVCLLEAQVKRPRWSRLHEARLIEDEVDDVRLIEDEVDEARLIKGGEGWRDHPVSEYFTAWRRQPA